METIKTFQVYKQINTFGYYKFFENIINKTIFTKINNIISWENPILNNLCQLFIIPDTDDYRRYFVGIIFDETAKFKNLRFLNYCPYLIKKYEAFSDNETILTYAIIGMLYILIIITS